MLDLRAIRTDPDAVKGALARRSPDLAARVDELLAADQEWRAATAAAESLRAEQRQASEAIGAAKSRGEDAGESLARVKDLSATVKERTEQARQNNRQQNLGVTWTRVFSNHTVGEFRYGLGLRSTNVDIAAGNDTPIIRFTNSPIAGSTIGNAGNFPIHRDQLPRLSRP